MNDLFFELIRVSLGIQEGLGRVPSADEWEELYELSRAQAIRGICSRGVQHLKKKTGYADNLSEILFLKWVGFANIIKEKNQVVNKQCVLLKKHFSQKGFDCSILKGQGMAAIYRKDDVDLRLLRQCGDIDLYVDGGRKKVQGYINQLFEGCRYDYKNIHAPFFDDTDVEVHWIPEILMNLCRNYKLQKFWKKHADKLFADKVELPDGMGEINVPTIAMNRFYILLHTYRHAFDEGVGLRQVMDYYFVLLQERSNAGKEGTMKLLKEFGMTKFAAAMMWIMVEVFHMDKEYLLCAPDEKEGRFLLNDIMQSGNFGGYDKRVKKMGNSIRTRSLTTNLQRAPHLFAHYPMEVMWAPVWMAYHFVWKRTVGRYN